MLMVLALGRLIAVGLPPQGVVALSFLVLVSSLCLLVVRLAGCLVWLSLGLVLSFGLSDFSLYFAGFSFLFLLGFMLF